MTISKWVTLLNFFPRHSHKSCLMLLPTASEWHCFISLPGTLINHVSSTDQQLVSDTALFHCQALSSIMSHPMTNRKWVTLFYFIAMHSHWSCLIPWPTASEWHCFIFFPGTLIPWPTESEWHCFISLPGILINHVSSHDEQYVSDTALFLCQEISAIMAHPMTNRKWVTLLYFFASHSYKSWLIPWPTGSKRQCFISLPDTPINDVSWPIGCEWHCFILCQVLSSVMPHPMTNRKWVTMIYFFARHSHQSCLITWSTGSEWHCIISLLVTLINHASSYNQQHVSDTALFLCQALSSIISWHPLTNSMWVTLHYFFARHSHWSCFMLWPTASEWHCFIACSLIMSHSMTNRKWVTLLNLFAMHSHHSYLIPWPTGSEWHCLICVPGTTISHLSSHDQQYVSDAALCLCQALSSIMSHIMTNRKCVTHLYFFVRHSHLSYLIPWPTVCEWHFFSSLQGTLIHHASSHDQQQVSDNALFPCQSLSSIMPHPMTNSLWVTLLYFFPTYSHQSCLISWPTACE